MIVYASAQVLPGDPGRQVLGREATPAAVHKFNQKLGYYDPLPVRYWHWLENAVQGDFGASYTDGRPVTDDLVPALQKSGFLALFAFLLCVPLGIVGGVIAALRRGRLTDRAITITGLSFAVMPEFVNARCSLQTGFAAGKPFNVVPGDRGLAARRLAAGRASTRSSCPRVAVALVLFGYIARIARAGTIEALSADYTRTATLKGMPRNLVLRRHVIRNAILPTIAVVATQTGYLFGGLVAIEKFFGYPGIGQLILSAAQIKNFPMLQACVSSSASSTSPRRCSATSSLPRSIRACASGNPRERRRPASPSSRRPIRRARRPRSTPSRASAARRSSSSSSRRRS